MSTTDLVEEASALLHKVYIRQKLWKFETDNPSRLRVEERNGKNLLIDRFTDLATWFGAYDGTSLIGCGRICGVDENGKLEIEGYQNSSIIQSFLPEDKSRCVELTKIAVDSDYLGKGIIRGLLQAVFEYCEQHRLSIIACTHNGHLKVLFKQICCPLKLEHAFKYEDHDPMPVNFYFADYFKSEIKHMLLALHKLPVKGTSTDLLKALEAVAPYLPTPIYWHDTSGRVLGINEHCLKAIGTSREIIGKTPYEFYPKEIAEYILNHNEQVMRTGEILSQEEMIRDITTGQVKYFSSIKAPLFDDEGNVIGIVGSSIETTAEKEKEQLELELQREKVKSKEQSKFRNFIGEMVHDIKSPLVSLKNLVQSAIELPASKRATLKSAAMTIADIAEHMLNKYSNSNNSPTDRQRQHVLLPVIIEKVISEKRFEYSSNVQFDLQLGDNVDFAFIKIEPIQFKRMLSNLINNAIEATNYKPEARIIIGLSACYPNNYTISVTDNGIGISQELIDKIHDGIVVTENKPDGHGIGMLQVRETLAINFGTLQIDSKINKGTTVSVSFPQATAPAWFTSEIPVTENSIIVILDNEASIHGTWDLRFQEIAPAIPGVKVLHFTSGNEALKFINSLSVQKRQEVILLSDYELLNEEIHGLDMVTKTGISKAILITSYYTNLDVQLQVLKAGIKMLPKDLVPKALIKFKEKLPLGSKKVHAIWVDDAFLELKSIIEVDYDRLQIDTYEDPVILLERLEQYPRETPIIFDYYFYFDYDERVKIMNGLTIAENLHGKGYTNLYLCTSEEISPDKIPPYLKYVLKTEVLESRSLSSFCLE